MRILYIYIRDIYSFQCNTELGLNSLNLVINIVIIIYHSIYMANIAVFEGLRELNMFMYLFIYSEE